MRYQDKVDKKIIEEALVVRKLCLDQVYTTHLVSSQQNWNSFLPGGLGCFPVEVLWQRQVYCSKRNVNRLGYQKQVLFYIPMFFLKGKREENSMICISCRIWGLVGSTSPSLEACVASPASPVAWVALNSYGSLGMLHTMDMYRRYCNAINSAYIA